MPEKIDVCVVTLNELPQAFIEHLYAAIPINNLIIDRSKPLGSSRLSLGKARQHAIQEITTEKFVFVDDDISLPKNWYQKIMNYWKEDFGWLEGWTIPTQPEWYKKWTTSRFNASTVKIIRQGERGFTADTVIRTDVVRDWNYEDGYEDLSLSNYVNSKGFKVVRAPVACWHEINYDIYDHYRKVSPYLFANRKRTFREALNQSSRTILSGGLHSVRQGDLAIFYNAVKLAVITR